LQNVLESPLLHVLSINFMKN